jgi:hypothetical protein
MGCKRKTNINGNLDGGFTRFYSKIDEVKSSFKNIFIFRQTKIIYTDLLQQQKIK